MGKPVKLDRDIGARLRALRAQNGLYQTNVAKALSVSYQSYQKMEAGKVSFRVSTLATLAGFFGVSLESIVGNLGL